jgi:hypothetical protein
MLLRVELIMPGAAGRPVLSRALFLLPAHLCPSDLLLAVIFPRLSGKPRLWPIKPPHSQASSSYHLPALTCTLAVASLHLAPPCPPLLYPQIPKYRAGQVPR